jgi:3-oxoacyl-[acyl-carrier protein] reductase
VALNCLERLDLLDETARAAEAAGAVAIKTPCDVSDYNAVKAAVDAAVAEFGRIDVLVNNAGAAHIGPFNLMEPGEWRRLIDVNINGTLNASRLVLPGMLARREGCIINVSSIWGLTGASCEAVYSMTKGAVNAFTKALAKETAPNGVRVNAIACGVIDTEMNAFLSPAERDELVANIPASRMGRPEEAAELALFLASGNAAYLTGQIIVLDGGMI